MADRGRRRRWRRRRRWQQGRVKAMEPTSARESERVTESWECDKACTSKAKGKEKKRERERRKGENETQERGEERRGEERRGQGGRRGKTGVDGEKTRR